MTNSGSKSNAGDTRNKSGNFTKKSSNQSRENIKANNIQFKRNYVKTEEDKCSEIRSDYELKEHKKSVKLIKSKLESHMIGSENLTIINPTMGGKYIENLKAESRKSIKTKTIEIKNKKKNSESFGFVNKNSVKLLEKVRPKNVPVEEILLSKAEINEMKKQQLKINLQSSHQPQICKNSRSIVSGKKDKREVFDRLYQDSIRMNYIKQLKQSNNFYQTSSKHSRQSTNNDQLEIDLLNIPYRGSFDKKIDGNEIPERMENFDNENHRLSNNNYRKPESDPLLLSNLVNNLMNVQSFGNLQQQMKKSFEPDMFTSYEQNQLDALTNYQQSEKFGQVYERGMAFLQKKDMKLEKIKEEIEEKEYEECFFYPETIDYFPKHELKKESKFKIVVKGNTYDLASETDLHNFFLKSIAKKGLMRNSFKNMYGSTSNLGNDYCSRKHQEEYFDIVNPLISNNQEIRENNEGSYANESSYQGIGKKSIFQKNIDNLNV